MKKKLLLLILCALAAGSMLEARRGHRGGYRRGWRGGYGYPGVGVGFTVPIGGGSSGPKMPSAAKQFKRLKGYVPNAREFCNWAVGYFNTGKAKAVCRQLENYLSAPRTYSRPSGYVSFGVGGGGYGGYGYPYGGYGWGRRGWW